MIRARSWLQGAVLWIVLAGTASAQAKKPLTVEIDSRGNLTVPPEYTACGRTPAQAKACADDATKCGDDAQSLSNETANAKPLRGLFLGGAIACASPDKPGVQLTVSHKITPAVLAGYATPLANLKKGLLWAGWREQDQALLVRKLAGLECIEHTSAGPGTCKVTEVPNSLGGNDLLLLTTADAEDVRRVELRLAANSLLTILVPHCELTATGTSRALIAGSATQTLFLSVPDACSEAFEGRSEIILESPGSLTIVAAVVGAGSGQARLVLTNVPSSVPTASTEWKLRSGGVLLGRVALRGVPNLDVDRDASGRATLEIEYVDSEINNLQTGETSSGLAIATNGDVDTSKATAWNLATVELSEELDSLAAELAKPGSALREPCGKLQSLGLDAAASEMANEVWVNDGRAESACADAQDSTACFAACEADEPAGCAGCDDESDTPACRACSCRKERQEWIAVEKALVQTPWRIRALSWTDSVRIEESFDGTMWWQDHVARARQLRSIKFATAKAHQDPLRVQVTLVDPTCPEREFFRTDVVLADRARVESLPLPVADLLFIACGEADSIVSASPFALGMGSRDPAIDSAINGAMRAVEDAQIEGGSCYLFYEPELYEDALSGRTKESLADFGPQGLAVTVSRDGAQPRTEYFPIRAPDKPERIVLRIPTGSDKGTGPYRVRATLEGAQHPNVVYRPARPQNGETNAATSSAVAPGEADGSFAFNAVLRPRGASGWRSLPIRTFVTFPIQFFGIRMPARARDLHASSESTSIQSFRPTAGAMFAIEPYDYDVGANPLPIPTQLMTGFHFIDLSQGELQFSFAAGLSFTFPIIDLPSGTANNQLGSSVAVGAFWELDMQEKFPLRDGNRFIITFGANVLSLFGSK